MSHTCVFNLVVVACLVADGGGGVGAKSSNFECLTGHIFGAILELVPFHVAVEGWMMSDQGFGLDGHAEERNEEEAGERFEPTHVG